MPKTLDDILDDLTEKSRRSYKMEIDLEGNIVSMPSDTLSFLGYSGKEIEALTIFDLIDEKDLEEVMKCIAQMPGNEEPDTHIVRILLKTGKRIQIRASPRPVSKDGKVVGVKCSFTPMDK